MIDARSMRKGQNGPSRYAENLIINLAKIDKDNRYTVIVNNEYASIVNADNFHIIPTSILPYRIKEHLAIPLLLQGEIYNVFHSLQYIPPAFIKRPLVMTVFDIMHMNYDFWGKSVQRKIIGKYVQLLSSFSVHRCHSIITISNYSANQIAKIFSYDRKRIFPIYLGINEPYAKRNNLKDFEYSSEKWNIKHPYILHISNMRLYKNVEILLEAFAKYVAMDSKKIMLVLAGKASEQDVNSKRELAKSLGIVDKVIFLRNLNNENLRALLGGSIAFVFPSKDEGFGLPLLEAMAAGIPCIASNLEVFSEVCDDAPLYFEKNSVADLKDSIIRLVSSDRLRREMAIKGIDKARTFSWENTAKMTIEVYNKVFEEITQ